tara:strand:- start:1981 stop:2190 length:210 start_codon:yes stop_codon:yes gene_type:complete
MDEVFFLCSARKSVSERRRFRSGIRGGGTLIDKDFEVVMEKVNEDAVEFYNLAVSQPEIADQMTQTLKE